MTPRDLLVDLRDIHTPTVVDGGGWSLSPWPLVAFAALLIIGHLWSRRRRSAWRREGAVRLAAVKKISDPAARWSALAALYRQVARHAGVTDPPDYLFRPKEASAVDLDHRLITEIERSLR